MIYYDLAISDLRSNFVNPKSAASSLHLFSLEDVSETERETIEREIWKFIDDTAAPIHKALLDRKPELLTDVERLIWTKFLISIRLRNPSFISDLKIAGTKELKKRLDEDDQYMRSRTPDDPESLHEVMKIIMPRKLKNFGLSLIPDLINDRNLNKYIFEMYWWVEEFGGCNNEVITSDNPCVIFPGLDSPNGILSLPISTKMIFFASQNKDAASRFNQAMSKANRLRQINKLTAHSSTRYIYCKNELPMNFIKNFKKTDSQKLSA
jgi:hypothetical protein